MVIQVTLWIFDISIWFMQTFSFFSAQFSISQMICDFEGVCSKHTCFLRSGTQVCRPAHLCSNTPSNSCFAPHLTLFRGRQLLGICILHLAILRVLAIITWQGFNQSTNWQCRQVSLTCHLLRFWFSHNHCYTKTNSIRYILNLFQLCNMSFNGYPISQISRKLFSNITVWHFGKCTFFSIWRLIAYS